MRLVSNFGWSSASMKHDHFSMSSAFRKVTAKCRGSFEDSTISQKTSSATTLLPSGPDRTSSSSWSETCRISIRFGKTLTFISLGFQSARTGILAPTSCFVWYQLKLPFKSAGALLDKEPENPDSGEGVASVLTWIGVVHMLRPHTPTAHNRMLKSEFGANPPIDAFNTLLGKNESVFFFCAGAKVPWAHSTSFQGSEPSLLSTVQEQT
mmetsp:Transcript_57349/g.134458  ORF Transcript_57349/g.134458 Transcript_57349/m.134458 type:complete len:209 (-) Transcript_57349:430-1056(-)